MTVFTAQQTHGHQFPLTITQRKEVITLTYKNAFFLSVTHSGSLLFATFVFLTENFMYRLK